MLSKEVAPAPADDSKDATFVSPTMSVKCCLPVPRLKQGWAKRRNMALPLAVSTHIYVAAIK